MDDELERRLRELVESQRGKYLGQGAIEDLLQRAARIGAETEREECAALVEDMPNGVEVFKCYQPEFDKAVRAIRARGSK